MMKETCKPIEELKEIIKKFMEIQIGFNDAINDDFEDITKEVDRLDKQTAEAIARLLGRVMCLGSEINGIKENYNDIKSLYNKKADKKVTEDINNIYHHLKKYRKRHNDFAEDIYYKINMIESKVDAIERIIKEDNRHASNK